MVLDVHVLNWWQHGTVGARDGSGELSLAGKVLICPMRTELRKSVDGEGRIGTRIERVWVAAANASTVPVPERAVAGLTI